MQIDGYTQGNAYHLTGKTAIAYGRVWLEAIFLEGHCKGQIVHLPRPEDVQAKFKKDQETWRRQQAAAHNLYKLTASQITVK